MQAMLLKLAAWLAKKLIAALVITVVALAAYGAWLFWQEEAVLEQNRLTSLQQALADREQLRARRDALLRQLTQVQTEIAASQERMRQAEKVIGTLRSLKNWWDRLWGNPAQQLANEEQVRRMEALKQTASGRLAELQLALTRFAGERAGVEGALRRTEQEVARLEESRSRFRQYVLLAWDQVKWYLATALAAYFCGPTLWALTLYYGLAPLLTRGRPICLGPAPTALPAVSESHVSLEAALGPGEVLRLRESFLQASDEGVSKRTRFVLDWRIPFTSAACGLIELLELRHPAAAGASHVTLSASDDPHIELALVTVPAGASLVLRPSFLAGVLQSDQARLVIRRHWRIFRWQAWIGGQFRFFEFVGPCRLVVTGSRGVRAECLAEREGPAPPARRTNQNATIGFTPNLAYRPVRAETFWSYYRGMNPLFDDLFAGHGLFLVQETSREGPAATAAAFWSGVWNGVLKVFGL